MKKEQQIILTPLVEDLIHSVTLAVLDSLNSAGVDASVKITFHLK